MEYFKEKHTLLLDDGTHKHAATSMISWFSMLKKFYKYTKRGNISEKLPMVEDLLKFWEKEHTVKKAYVFTPSEWSK
jgi:hypothetical protein